MAVSGIVRSVVLAGALVLLAGCTTSIEGNGTRIGSGGATDFPSSSTAPPTSSSSSGSSSGGSADDAKALVEAMIDDMSSVEHGFRITGDFDDSGSTSGLDLTMQGDSGTGTISFDGATCQLRSVDGSGWANAPAAFWTDEGDVDDAVAAQIADQWVELSGSIASLRTFVDQDEFFDGLVDTSDDFTFGDTSTVGGVSAREVSDGDETYVVAVDSPHLLFAITDDTGTATVSFPDTDPVVETPSPTIPFPG